MGALVELPVMFIKCREQALARCILIARQSKLVGRRVSGAELNYDIAMKARQGETEQIKKREIYRKVKEETCRAVTAKNARSHRVD